MLQEPPAPEKRARFQLLRSVIVVAAIGALVLAFLGSPTANAFLWPAGFAASSQGLTPSPNPPTAQPPTPTATATLSPETESAPLSGLVIVSISEFGYAHLFRYQPSSEPFTRLTNGDWDDIYPAISPDGSNVAFASNRGGQWDLYVLDLQTGATQQISNDAAYDGRPSWSSDGAWLAYEHYEGDSVEIYIRPIDGSIEPVAVSAHPGLDYAPAWRPGTQQIAFISDRGGRQQLWLVDLASTDSARFSQIAAQNAEQRSPVWSPAGDVLAWAQLDGNAWNLYTTLIDANDPVHFVGVGEEPRWNPEGDALLATFRNAQHMYLTAYTLDGALVLPPVEFAGRFEGAAWGSVSLPDPLPDLLLAAAEADPSTDWAAALADDAQHAADLQTTALADVSAPFAQLNEAVVEPFSALRQRSAELLGWDALSNLENAFVPINEPLPPMRQQDWLYTGRAFALHANLLDDWLVAVREVVDGQTYWRVYLRSAAGGDLGRPLTELPWDFAARYSGGETAFQNGGELAESLPAGSWIDFTALAADYGFERLPALPNWRSFFPSVMFNEFALRAGLTWEAAMLQLHPVDAVATAAASHSE